MFASIMTIFKGISSAATILDWGTKYVIQPLLGWWRRRKDKKIDKHYDKKKERIERLYREVEDLRKQENSPEIDEKLRNSLRKLKNMGVKDGNDD